jgi:hypothetical protein
LSGCSAKIGSAASSTTTEQNVSTSTLNVDPAAVAFGNVAVDTPATQTVTLTSAGNAPVTVTAAAVSGPGFTLQAAALPVTLDPGQSATLSVQFDPTVAGSAAGQLTIASDASAGATRTIALSGVGTAPPVPTSALNVDATAVAFGDVAVDLPATQTVTLTSAGTAAVTVSAAAVTGPGFTLQSAAFPLTLASGQSAELNVQFDPAAAGSAAGQLTIDSNASAGATQTIPLSGVGTAPVVDLSWDAPAGTSDYVAGYDVYRAPSGTSDFQLLASSDSSQTDWTDSTVQSGQAYDYYVESVNAMGWPSPPSDTITVTVP